MCSREKAKKAVSMQCSLKCVQGCDELCAASADFGKPKAELLCKAQCTGQCIKVCGGE